MFMLLLYAGIAIGVSFLCSLLEASLLSVPRGHVELLAERGNRSGKVLQKMKQDIDRPLGAILTLNTIAHTVGAAGVGSEVAAAFGDDWLGLASAVMTLLILVLSEIIPKTLGAVHAKALSGFTASTTRLLMIVCAPLLFLLEQMNRVIGGKKKESTSRAELIATLQLGQKGGALSRDELHVMQNVFALRAKQLVEILTPRTVVFSLPASKTVAETLAEHSPLRFSRIPLHGDTPEEMDRYVTRHDLHDGMVNGKGDETLASLARPMPAVPALASVAKALDQALRSRHHIMAVVDEFGGLAGIVTLEDLVETLLGAEIVDETDPAVDMQEMARQLANR